MNDVLVFTEGAYGTVDIQLAMLLDEMRRPKAIFCLPMQKKSIVGNIYAAKVEHVIKNQGAFLRLSPEHKAYLPLSKKFFPLYLHHSGKSVFPAAGDWLFVQVIKDAMGSKDAMCDTHLRFHSENAVLTLGKWGNGISKKISPQRREELAALLEEYKSREFSLILRTSAQSVEGEALKKELADLVEYSVNFTKRNQHKMGGTLLLESDDLLVELLRSFSKEAGKIVTDLPETYEKLREILKMSLFSHLSDKLSLYDDPSYSMWKLYGIKYQLEGALRTKVWMKSGASLVIESTEAMTVIDVNSAKHQGKPSLSNDFLEINIEAAKEIARQFRLRNLSGIIVVDFISMKRKEDEAALLSAFRAAVAADERKVTVHDVTELGLVEVTREKRYPTLAQVLGS